MDALNIEKVNQFFVAFRQAARLDDHDHLLLLMNALADSGQAGEGGAYENLFVLLADLLEAHDRRAHPMPDVTPDMRRPGFAQECQRQCLLAAQADKADVALQAFMEGVLLDDQVGWTDTDETPRSTASRPEDFRGQGKGGGTKALLCDRVTDRAKE